MKINGANHYFDNFEELEEFLINKGFKYEIPVVNEEDLKEGKEIYIVEIRNDKIIYCAVESISNGSIYNSRVFYDNSHAYSFRLSDVMSFAEASRIWGLGDSTLRGVVRQNRLIEGVDYRKSCNTWLITKNAMIKLYGEPKEK